MMIDFLHSFGTNILGYMIQFSKVLRRNNQYGFHDLISFTFFFFPQIMHKRHYLKATNFYILYMLLTYYCSRVCAEYSVIRL